MTEEERLSEELSELQSVLKKANSGVILAQRRLNEANQRLAYCQARATDIQTKFDAKRAELLAAMKLSQ